MNQYFSAMRIDEFKYTFTAEIENGFVQKGSWGGFSGPIATETGGVVITNLYTNPQEDVSIGVRHIPMDVPLLCATGDYYEELIAYPPRFKIGFISNNPPIYHILPKAKERCDRRSTSAPRRSLGSPEFVIRCRLGLGVEAALPGTLTKEYKTIENYVTY